MSSLNELSAKVHQTAVEHGWWEDEDYNFGEKLALIHSEVSEALEAWRETDEPWYGDGKPEGWGIELIDAVIRILDLMGVEDLDIDLLMQVKMDYNGTRPYKHGGKRI